MFAGIGAAAQAANHLQVVGRIITVPLQLFEFNLILWTITVPLKMIKFNLILKAARKPVTADILEA